MSWPYDQHELIHYCLQMPNRGQVLFSLQSSVKLQKTEGWMIGNELCSIKKNLKHTIYVYLLFSVMLLWVFVFPFSSVQENVECINQYIIL